LRRRKCLESAPPAASQPRAALGSISSSRCQITCAPSAHVHRRTTAESALIDFLTNEFLPGLLRPTGNGRQSRVWWSQTGSNRRPPACKAGALPTELWPRRQSALASQYWLARRAVARGGWHRPPSLRYGAAAFAALRERRLVGLGRFELPTSRLSSARSNQLSYKPGTGVSNQ
jgi:hypothetical protein